MVLENVRMKDAGKYACYTRDDANVMLGTIEVFVYGKFKYMRDIMGFLGIL